MGVESGPRGPAISASRGAISSPNIKGFTHFQTGGRPRMEMAGGMHQPSFNRLPTKPLIDRPISNTPRLEMAGGMHIPSSLPRTDPFPGLPRMDVSPPTLLDRKPTGESARRFQPKDWEIMAIGKPAIPKNPDKKPPVTVIDIFQTNLFRPVTIKNNLHAPKPEAQTMKLEPTKTQRTVEQPKHISFPISVVEIPNRKEHSIQTISQSRKAEPNSVDSVEKQAAILRQIYRASGYSEQQAEEKYEEKVRNEQRLQTIPLAKPNAQTHEETQTQTTTELSPALYAQTISAVDPQTATDGATKASPQSKIPNQTQPETQQQPRGNNQEKYFTVDEKTNKERTRKIELAKKAALLKKTNETGELQDEKNLTGWQVAEYLPAPEHLSDSLTSEILKMQPVDRIDKSWSDIRKEFLTKHFSFKYAIKLPSTIPAIAGYKSRAKKAKAEDVTRVLQVQPLHQQRILAEQEDQPKRKKTKQTRNQVATNKLEEQPRNIADMQEFLSQRKKKNTITNNNPTLEPKREPIHLPQPTRRLHAA